MGIDAQRRYGEDHGGSVGAEDTVSHVKTSADLTCTLLTPSVGTSLLLVCPSPRPSPLFAALRAPSAHTSLANMTSKQLDRHKARARVEATRASAQSDMS